MPRVFLQDIKIFIPLLLISTLLFWADNFQILNLPKSFFQYITTPIQYGLYRTSLNIGKQFEFIVLARKSAQEKKALSEQLSQILSENANLRRKLAETEGFLDQQKALNPQTFNLVAARPIGINRFLLLDKGTSDGIKVNQVVIYKDNYLGKIIEVSPNRAQALLSSDPDSHILSFVNNTNGKGKGVLNGQFGQDMVLDKILHQEPIEKDDLVYSEGSEVEIPRGLILGRVSEVLNKDVESFKQAKVKPIFIPGDLEIVFIVTN